MRLVRERNTFDNIFFKTVVHCANFCKKLKTNWLWSYFTE